MPRAPPRGGMPEISAARWQHLWLVGVTAGVALSLGEEGKTTYTPRLPR